MFAQNCFDFQQAIKGEILWKQLKSPLRVQKARTKVQKQLL